MADEKEFEFVAFRNPDGTLNRVEQNGVEFSRVVVCEPVQVPNLRPPFVMQVTILIDQIVEVSDGG